MKFLLDAHLPKKLSLFLSWKGYDSLHTLDLPNKNATKDSEINQISIDEKRVVISKDLDFIESLLISNKPYKLICLVSKSHGVSYNFNFCISEERSSSRCCLFI